MAINLDSVHLWTAKEAAYYCRININYLYRLSRITPKKGGPPVLKIGKVYRYPREEFIAWVKNPKDIKCSV